MTSKSQLRIETEKDFFDKKYDDSESILTNEPSILMEI